MTRRFRSRLNVLLGFFCSVALLLGISPAAFAEGGLKLAVVSLGVNDWGNSMSVSGGKVSATYIEGAMTDLLARTEKAFAALNQVIPAKSFIANAEYRALSIGKFKDGLYGPSIDGNPLPSFTTEQKEIIKCVLKPETASQLCKVLGADLVAVVYTEWAVATGGFIPTSRALTKNCLAVYSADGKQRFFDRQDVKGAKAIGGMGRVSLSEETIGQWVDAYEKGIVELIGDNKKKLN
jgi:hypothetical protein